MTKKTHLSSFMQLQAAAQDSLYASNREMFYKENCTNEKCCFRCNCIGKIFLQEAFLHLPAVFYFLIR